MTFTWRAKLGLKLPVRPKRNAQEFVERSGLKLNIGDRVTVIGMPVVMNGRQVVLAREVRTTNHVLIVRDEVGRPLWEKHSPILMDPERRTRGRKQSTSAGDVYRLSPHRPSNTTLRTLPAIS